MWRKGTEMPSTSPIVLVPLVRIRQKNTYDPAKLRTLCGAAGVRVGEASARSARVSRAIITRTYIDEVFYNTYIAVLLNVKPFTHTPRNSIAHLYLILWGRGKKDDVAAIFLEWEHKRQCKAGYIGRVWPWIKLWESRSGIDWKNCNLSEYTAPCQQRFPEYEDCGRCRNIEGRTCLAEQRDYDIIKSILSWNSTILRK